jgi:hypothetical protein
MPARNEFANSRKQREIMRLICEATSTGVEITTNDLCAGVSYGPVSKQAITCSLRALERHGMIATTRHGNRSATIAPTTKGFTVFMATPDPVPEDGEALH